MEKVKLFDEIPDATKIQLIALYEYMKTQGSLPIDPTTLDVSNSSEHVAPKQKTLDRWLIKTPPKSTAATKESVQNTPNTQTGENIAISSNSDQECQEINTNIVQQPEKLYQNDLHQCNMNPIVIVKKLNLTGINLTNESSLSSVEVAKDLMNASIQKEQINKKTSSDVKFSDKLIPKNSTTILKKDVKKLNSKNLNIPSTENNIELQDNSNTSSSNNVETKTIEDNTEPCSSEFKITPNSLQKTNSKSMKIISKVRLDNKKNTKNRQQVISSSESISSKTNKEIDKDDSVISFAGSSSNKVTDMCEVKGTKRIRQKANFKVVQTESSTSADRNILPENEGSPLILNQTNIENTLGSKTCLRRKSQSSDSSQNINTVEKSPIVISPQNKNTKELKQLVISNEDSLVTSENNSETFHSHNFRCLRSKRVFSADTQHKSINEKLENQYSNNVENKSCEVTDSILADDGLETKMIKNKKLHDKNKEFTSNSVINKINNSEKKKTVDEKANKNVNNFALNQEEKLPSEMEIVPITNDVNNCLSHEIKSKSYIKKKRKQVECSTSNCNISHARESIEPTKYSVSSSNNKSSLKNVSSDCHKNAEYQTETVSCKDTVNKNLEDQKKIVSFKETDDKNLFLPKIKKEKKNYFTNKNIREQKSILLIKKKTHISKTLSKDSDILKTCTTLTEEIKPLSDKNFNQKKFKCSNIETLPENKINDIKETETKSSVDDNMNTSVMCDENTKNNNCSKNNEPFSEKQHTVDVNMSCSSPEIGFKKKVLKRPYKNRSNKNSVLSNTIDVMEKNKCKRKKINKKNCILTSSQDTSDQLSPNKNVTNESKCNKKNLNKFSHSLTSSQVIFDQLPPNDNDMKQFQYNSYCKIKKICSTHGLALDDIFQRKEFKDMIEKYRNNPGAVLFIGTQKCPTTGRCEPIVSVHKSKKQLLEIAPGIQPKN